MKYHLDPSPPNQKFIWRQNYPIIWNGDRHYWNLFLYSRSESTIFKAGHNRIFFSNYSTFRKNNQTLALVNSLKRMQHGGIATFEIRSVYCYMQATIHIAKHGHFRHGTLAHKNGIDRI